MSEESDTWTILTLKEYFTMMLTEREARYLDKFRAAEVAIAAALIAQDKSVTQALTSSKEAVTKAEIASEKRFEGLNELRKVVTDTQALQMPRTEATALFKAQEDRLTSFQATNQEQRLALVKTFEDKLDLRKDGLDDKIKSTTIAFEKTTDSLKEEIRSLSLSRSVGEGRQVGIQAAMAYVFVASAIVAILTHYIIH